VQFELAVKAKDGDVYQASAADSRLRAGREELSEQKKRATEARG